MKICTKCGETKNESEFGKCLSNTDGLNSWCKACFHDYNQKWYKNNSENMKKYMKEWSKNNPEYKKEWYKNNSEKVKEAAKQWRTDNPEKAKEADKQYSKNRRANDNNYKLLTNLRARITSAVKLQSGNKAYRSIELLGCSIEEVRQHLEKQFQPGMTWDNYGLYGWHIDHIIPCDSFDLTKEEEQKKCFHYTNLQPLWAADNLSKGNKIIS